MLSVMALLHPFDHLMREKGELEVSEPRFSFSTFSAISTPPTPLARVCRERQRGSVVLTLTQRTSPPHRERRSQGSPRPPHFSLVILKVPLPTLFWALPKGACGEEVARQSPAEGTSWRLAPSGAACVCAGVLRWNHPAWDEKIRRQQSWSSPSSGVWVSLRDTRCPGAWLLHVTLGAPRPQGLVQIK